MTNDELRARLKTALPIVLREIQARGGRRILKPDPDEAAAWQSVALVVKDLTGQVLHQSVASLVEPEDIVQRVILKLQSETVVTRVRNSDAPLAYLRGLVRFALLDYIDARTGEVLALADLDERSQMAPPEPAAPEDRESAQASPSVARLRWMLRKLPASDRRLLRMRFWQNLTIGEIAKKLGEPYSRVAVRMHRLIKHLREGPVIRRRL